MASSAPGKVNSSVTTRSPCRSSTLASSDSACWAPVVISTWPAVVGRPRLVRCAATASRTGGRSGLGLELALLDEAAQRDRQPVVERALARAPAADDRCQLLGAVSHANQSPPDWPWRERANSGK